jgi:hypothetical protein
MGTRRPSRLVVATQLRDVPHLNPEINPRDDAAPPAEARCWQQLKRRPNTTATTGKVVAATGPAKGLVTVAAWP